MVHCMIAARMTLPVSLWLALGLGAAGAQNMLVQSTPMEVTTDTVEYCDQLVATALRQETRQPVPQEARLLSEEGRQMCDQGKVRGGILRLRRALLLMQAGR
jgi:hypothetical protein